MRVIQAVSYLVREYQEAIDWFTQCLDFEVLTDTDMGNDKRFVKVAPQHSDSFSLVLIRTISIEDYQPGQQANGVFLFLQTDNFDQDYQSMVEKGVRFLESPRDESYAKVAVFEDLYGNKWDLIQPKL